MSFPIFQKIIQLARVLRPLHFKRPTAAFFLYHTIEVEPSPWTLGHRYITPFSDFKKQIAYLQKHFEIESTSSLIQKLESNQLKKNSAAIHFDDGFRSYSEIAVPYLRKKSIPSAVFLLDSVLDGEIPIRNKIAYCLNQAKRKELLELSGQPHDLSNARFLSWIKDHLTPDLKKKIEQLYSAFKPGPATDGPFLTRPEVRAFSADPLVEIGSHTLRHPILAGLDEASQREEILTGHQKIETLIGRHTRFFAYPFGGTHHFNSTSRKIVCEQSDLIGFSTYGGINYSLDRANVKRITLTNHRDFDIKLNLLEAMKNGGS